MDPSKPPEPLIGLLLAALPALGAAVFAMANAAVGTVPDSRKAALRATLSGGARSAVDRYLGNPAVVETRWLVLRILGIATSAILMFRAIPATLDPWRHLLAILGVLIAYGVPSEMGIIAAKQAGERMIPKLLQSLRPFELLIAPAAAPLIWLGLLTSRFTRSVGPPSSSLAESEVEILVNEGELNGSIAHDQSEMIRNVLDFGDIRAGDVMVPRTQVTALDIETPGSEILQFVSQTAHSRYPVYRKSIDNVVGVLHVKDLIRYAAAHDVKDMEVEDIMRTPVVFVPESQSASSVLMDMRAGRRHHMAILLDEFGGMSGVLTLEDLIEEIVGDIRDEHDDEDPPIVDLGNGRLMVDAGVSIGDLSRYLGVELPENGSYNSLGGFIVERMGQVPEVGARLTEYGLDFVVRDADERHISKVEIVRLSPTPDSVPPASSRQSAAQ